MALTEDAPSSHDFNVDNEVTLSEANSASLAVRPSKGLFDLSPFSI